MGTLFLIEVKQGMATEREALTELSAYSQGLQLRFWGLSPADLVWMPVTEEWRTTVRAGMAYQTLWSGITCLPVQYECDVQNNKITGMRLKLVDLLEPIPDEIAYSVFAWDTFDAFTIVSVHSWVEVFDGLSRI